MMRKIWLSVMMTVMDRGYNFGAGPAMLPEEILLEARQELLNWNGTGMSVMEIGHRTPEFMALIQEAELMLRDLLVIPSNYHVLFLGGAARSQFAMIPLNFAAKNKKAGYMITGIWSKMAYEEALKIKGAYEVINAGSDFTEIPSDNWLINEDSSYIYYVPNETVNGLRFPFVPQVGQIPLVADMTSCLLTEPFDINDFALIFAGAQKNIANAGLTITIIRDDFLQTIKDNNIPTMFDYRTHADTNSMYATPPTFNCYLALKMFHWLRKNGGMEHFYLLNQRKAALLYDYIDNSSMYYCPIKKTYRSLINACFRLNASEMETAFLEQAKKNQLLALAGHRLVGGLRASMYNAMPLVGVEQLVQFMKNFARDGV